MIKRQLFVLIITPLLFLTSCVNNPLLVFEFNFLPVLYVVENPVNPSRAKLLADALGIEDDIIAADGSIRYIDKERFQALPMTALGEGEADEDNNATILEGFDFEAIKSIKPLNETEALARAEQALEQAGLVVQEGKAKIGHSRFEAVSKNGTSIADVQLDTHIDFESVTPNGFSLKGPGADIKIVFNGQGEVTQLNYAFRVLAEGQRSRIISAHEAKMRATAKHFDVNWQDIQFYGQCAGAKNQLGTLCLESEMVYYAPPIEEEVTEILPHYLFKGDFTVDGATVEVRNLLIPAVENAPSITLNTSVSGNDTISAEASVTGGKAPYSYAWSSSSTPLTVADSASIQYTVASREPITKETLSVIVTDANGASTWTSQTLAVDAAQAELSSLQTATTSVGAEWIGITQGLPYASSNTRGFLSKVEKAGVNVAFNWGEQVAYHKDFAKETDSQGIETVDFLFYTGHAYGLGFFFESKEEKRSFTSDQASWGEQDLEWLLIAACGPLQEKEAGIPWWLQWGRAFNGLHLMLAYANTTFDNNREGAVFGQDVFEKRLMLRQAWATAATEVQTPTEIYAVMGVWGENNVNNYNDHFWNLGPVGPDIPSSSIQGYWRLSGPS